MFMNLCLFAIIILFLSSSIVFAESESDIEDLNNTGRELFALGELEEALTYFDRVLETDPNHIKALINKGIALAQIGKPEEALTYFDRVLETDPNHIKALNNKGGVLTLQGKFYEATFYFSKVLKINPEHEDAKIRLDNVKDALSYNSIDGILEVIVRDDHGDLVTYEMTTDFWVLDHAMVRKEISEKFAKKVITRNGQEVEVFQLKKTQSIDEDTIISKWSVATIYNPETHIIYGHSYQCPLEKGDVAELVFTIFSLPE